MRHPIFAVLGFAGLVSVLFLPTACRSSGDPSNGVSIASYRTAVQRADTNLHNVQNRLQASEEQDAAQPSPTHSRAWWDAQIEEVSATADILDAALKGATYTATTGK